MFLHKAIVLLSIAVAIIDAANILVLPAHIGPSHKKSMQSMASALGKRGHHVVVWSPVVKAAPMKTKDFTDLEVEITTENRMLLDGMRFQNDTKRLSMGWKMGPLQPWIFLFGNKISCDVCAALLKHDMTEFEKIVSLAKWDVLIIDSIFTPCGFAVSSRAPDVSVVMWSTAFHLATSTVGEGMPEVVAVYPGVHATPWTDLRRFSSRLDNTVHHAMNYFPVETGIDLLTRWAAPGILDDFSYRSFAQKSHYFVGQLPTVIDFPRPLTPDAANLLMYCPKGKPLPDDLREFVEDPTSDGTIVIAFGHNVKWSGAPAYIRESFEQVLSRYTNFRIIWQFDIDTAPTNQTHIRRMKWLPQVDLLFHPKTKLFVSHCGLKSTCETICAGVPIIAMAQGAEQYRNALLIEKHHVGHFVDKFTLTADGLAASIDKVLGDVSYKQAITRLGKMLNDQILPAENYDAFVVERVIRQRANLLKLRDFGATMSWTAYFCADILFSFVLAIAAIVGSFSFLSNKFR